ncbi:MAG: DUF1549 and DUF1553 domain-containing protein [Verrucomicrobiales bacterium]|nr:DUF1549 and DUF1553 domain-containing protein [Verrucomicrobiales bacterium]
MKVYFLAGLYLLLLSTAVSAEDVAILPAELTLTGPEATHRIMAVELNKDGLFSGENESATFASSDETVVSVENGTLIPRGNGKATISTGSATAQVTVTNFDQDFSWSFSNHVLPVFAKNDCNMGACHGAIAGKGGFRLSLKGYDPPGDFYTITREMQGRRIEPADPARSLILTKPTMATPHKGGKKLDTRSFDYRVVAEWIAGGAKPPGDEAELKHLEVLPEQSLLKTGDRQQLIVRAHYGDGRIEDVTHWAKFTSADATVAEVDDTGKVEIIGPGEGAVTAWFSSQVVLARMTVPFRNDIPAEWFSQASRANFIDDLVLTQLEQLNLKPSRKTTEHEFFRRVYLDTIGVLPKPEEVTAFVEDQSPDKRSQLIDHLLQREEYVDYWTYRYSDIFLVNGKLLRPEAVKAYYMWIRDNVAKNTPWDEFARQLVIAKGDSYENGATNFYAVHQDPETMAENISQAFLCLSINCAKCHNHPLEKWTNDQYYSFANLFARVRSKGWGGDSRNGDGKRTLYVEPRGDLIQPRTGKPQPPAPLDGTPIPEDATDDRRNHLADWLTSPDNPYFARAITNRIWAAYFGRGLVDPVDDLRVSNPASNEPLLAALSDHLIKNDFNVKAVMKAILESETYQRASEPVPENKADTRYFSRYYPRRHMAEILHDAINSITQTTPSFNNLVLGDGSKSKTEVYEKGTRSLELYDSAVESYFLKVFGRNNREITCECERSNQPSMVQVLHLSNGDTLNKNLSQKDGLVDQLLKLDGGVSEIIEKAYLLCLSRPPTDSEKQQFTDLYTEDIRTSTEDLLWALMTSREFLFQH